METRIGYFNPVRTESSQHAASCEELVGGANRQVEALQLECVEQPNNAVPVFYGRPNKQLLQRVHAFFTYWMCTQNMGYEAVLARGELSSQEFNKRSRFREISIYFPSVDGATELHIGQYDRGFFMRSIPNFPVHGAFRRPPKLTTHFPCHDAFHVPTQPLTLEKDRSS